MAARHSDNIRTWSLASSGIYTPLAWPGLLSHRQIQWWLAPDESIVQPAGTLRGRPQASTSTPSWHLKRTRPGRENYLPLAISSKSRQFPLASPDGGWTKEPDFHFPDLTRVENVFGIAVRMHVGLHWDFIDMKGRWRIPRHLFLFHLWAWTLFVKTKMFHVRIGPECPSHCLKFSPKSSLKKTANICCIS